MNILYEKSFLRDIKKVKDRRILRNLLNVIKEIKDSKDLSTVYDIKKLKGHSSAFRIKIGDYRLGFFLESDMVIITRFLNRKDIYKLFP